MTCESVRDLLDQYVAGAVDAEVAVAIRGHLMSCQECGADEAAARFLAPRVAALPRAVAPSRPLWTGIESRLKPRSRGLALRWLPLAAAIGLIVGAGWWSQRGAGRDQQLPTPEWDQSRTVVYQMAASELEASLLGEGRIAAAAAPAVRRDVQTLDAAIEETSSALQADPGNEVLRQLHLSALRRKLDVLRRVAALHVES
ncbi:MAG TPA: zf-HC2 domain-containing protein [Gemmatimonadales bacterium]